MHILNTYEIGLVHWPWVLMQLGNNILKLVWGLLCFWAAQLFLNLSLNDVNFVQYKSTTSEDLLNVNFNLQICFCPCPASKKYPAKLTRWRRTDFATTRISHRPPARVYSGLVFNGLIVYCCPHFHHCKKEQCCSPALLSYYYIFSD